MEEFIKRVTDSYIKGLITRDEYTSIIAREYAKRWARGQLLKQFNFE
jgi:hypothetical protein